MLDPAEIAVDDDQRSAQRRQLAGIRRFGKSRLRSRASRIARNLRLIESLWRYGIGGNLAGFGCNLTRSVYIELACMHTLRWIGTAFLVLLGLMLIVPGLVIAINTDWQPTRNLREDEVARIRAANAFVETNKVNTGRLPTTDEFSRWADSAPNHVRLDGVGFTYLPLEEGNYIFDWYGGRGVWLSWKSHSRLDLANISLRDYFIFGSKWADILVFLGLGAAALWGAKLAAPNRRNAS